jgi:glyceraldehyde 3-phosphate dehydrogenase
VHIAPRRRGGDGVAIRIGINGLGRIGRGFLRLALREPDLEVVAVNDLARPPILAHLLRHDSLYGPPGAVVAAEEGAIVAGGRRIAWSGGRVPADIDWKASGADFVIEATGCFTGRDAAGGHLERGARRVVISSPSPDADVTLCAGVNEEAYDPERHRVVSNASSTRR